jgi:hypothetical protein
MRQDRPIRRSILFPHHARLRINSVHLRSRSAKLEASREPRNPGCDRGSCGMPGVDVAIDTPSKMVQLERYSPSVPRTLGKVQKRCRWKKRKTRLSSGLSCQERSIRFSFATDFFKKSTEISAFSSNPSLFPQFQLIDHLVSQPFSNLVQRFNRLRYVEPETRVRIAHRL